MNQIIIEYSTTDPGVRYEIIRNPIPSFKYNSITFKIDDDDWDPSDVNSWYIPFSKRYHAIKITLVSLATEEQLVLKPFREDQHSLYSDEELCIIRLSAEYI